MSNVQVHHMQKNITRFLFLVGTHRHLMVIAILVFHFPTHISDVIEHNFRKVLYILRMYLLFTFNLISCAFQSANCNSRYSKLSGTKFSQKRLQKTRPNFWNHHKKLLWILKVHFGFIVELLVIETKSNKFCVISKQ